MLDDSFEVIGSHSRDCPGVDKDREEVLHQPEEVVVMVHKNGYAHPLCRCFYEDSTMCHAEEDAEKQGPCNYFRAIKDLTDQ